MKIGKFIRFLNCEIDSSKKVFEPRIETEFWVEKSINEIKNLKLEIKNLLILDIFAGSGCIGIAILKNIKNSRVDFTDISKESIEQIKINLRLNEIPKDRYRIYKTNLFENLERKKPAPYRNEVSGAGYDIIFANPPYVALNRISEVQKEVLQKEPREALFAGRDGMFWIKKFFKEVKKHLHKNGVVYLEFDPLQKEVIQKILEKEGFNFSFRKDQFRKYRWLKASP
jgi:release factor glutamine methyltransferase